MSSAFECPKCSSADTRLVRSIRNATLIFLDFILGLALWWIADGGAGGSFLLATRKCRECGTKFRESKPSRRRKLDECLQCKYSLIGNVSGLCPECGWKLTRAQKRFVRKKGIDGDSVSNQP